VTVTRAGETKTVSLGDWVEEGPKPLVTERRRSGLQD
jgi:hypothetical protein